MDTLTLWLRAPLERLQRDIMPSVCEALTRIAAERPADPLRLMGEHLIKEAQKVLEFRVSCDAWHGQVTA